jgi:hypothetical protein
MIDGDPSREIRQDCLARFINGQEKVAFRCESNMGNIRAVSKGEGI